MSLEVALRGRRGEFELSVDLSLPAAGVSALFGPSGAGKTTLLRAIAGLEHWPGRVSFGGESWQDDPERTFLPVERRELGFVFQSGALFEHLNVADNLRYGARRRRPRTEALADEVVDGLGLRGLLARSARELSAGQRQRVALGRAVLSAPRLLLLDEPLANLDAQARREILRDLERVVRRGALPVLYVTHAWNEVERLAERVILLEEGRVREVGAVPEVSARLEPTGDWEDEVGVVVEVEVVGHHDEDRLTELAFGGGRLYVPRRELPLASRRRIRILARDVSLTLASAVGTSILNILPVEVVEVRRLESNQPLVVLDLGGGRLLARVTHRSVRTLEIAPGRQLWAQIKGVALLP